MTGFSYDSCIVQQPGIGLLAYIPVSEIDLTVWPAAVKNSTYNQQSGAGELAWYAMPYVQGTGNWTEEQQENEQGQYFRSVISVFLPSDSGAVRSELEAMKRHRFVLKVTRGTESWLIGTPENPLRFTSSYDTGSEGGDSRGHRCSFSGLHIYKSPFYTPVF
jgi:hypothetical protein